MIIKDMGIKKLRVTGGEPLVRRDIMSFLTACGGSRITATKGPGNTCDVNMKSISPDSYGFEVEMEFGCEAKGKFCYEITYLSCQGEVKSDAVPINLFATGDCKKWMVMTKDAAVGGWYSNGKIQSQPCTVFIGVGSR